MTAPLRPFWRYYGGKWRAALRYPQPLHDTIVEPFAGAAGYSLHYADRDVILVERYAVIAAIWRWLIGVGADEVRAIPLVDDVAHLPSWVAPAARALIGFAMNAATTSPRKALSSAARSLRANGRRFYGWSEDMRERVASQVGLIRHWKLIEGDYTEAPDIVATWYIDGPYDNEAGEHYVHGRGGLNYSELAAWCRARRGQPIVCEQLGATWLPFRSMGSAKSGPRSGRSAEAVWP